LNPPIHPRLPPATPLESTLLEMPQVLIPNNLNLFRMNTSSRIRRLAQFWCNVSPFRINTYKSGSKQTTSTIFRINTYEKQGEGGGSPQTVDSLSLKNSSLNELLCFQSLAHSSYTTAPAHLFSNQSVTHSFHSDGGLYPPQDTGHGVTGHQSRVTSHVPRLLHCFPHGTPTPRPTLPGKSPVARRDRARHSRFAAFHRAAPAGRSALLDRNWRRPW
jgi:hypothetical protein